MKEIKRLKKLCWFYITTTIFFATALALLAYGWLDLIIKINNLIK